jgi:lipoprotein-releasing system ATP-binding protein
MLMNQMMPASAAIAPILQLDDVRRTFKQGPREITVLQGANAELMPGQAVALVGPSGAGKSTLLHIAGLLESPSSGRVILNGRDCAELSEGERTRLRRQSIGFIYQFHQLLPEFSALENVIIPQLIMGKTRRAAETRARELLTGLGLGDRVDHRPAELSGGEQQRTAICRGLANSPKLLLADEPTGNLDPKTSEYVFRELVDLIRAQGVAALIATHNMELAARMDRTLKLENGQLVEHIWART